MAVTADFTHALPKVELHAHLTGSITPAMLHDVWTKTQHANLLDGADDPLKVIRPTGNDIMSFFPLFDTYIYNLINDTETVETVVAKVIDNFRRDGVIYLELRTTPRAHSETGMTRAAYVEAVNYAVLRANERWQDITTKLILSIDRRMSLEQAFEVVELASRYQEYETPLHNSISSDAEEHSKTGSVVGIDLCGNPMSGDVSAFTAAFERAKAYGLKVTVHFAEVPQSSAHRELETILSWHPRRLGHVIHVPDCFKEVIKQRQLGLELCLSCNVMAGLTRGGYAGHHFREWIRTDCPIALGTDDVGIFASPLSNEYLLAAQHFGLSREDLIGLSINAARCAFSNPESILARIREFRQNGQTEEITYMC